QEYVHNGFKVGPNFREPPADVADSWIDSKDPHIAPNPIEHDDWWNIFRDPDLDRLIDSAYRQNLDLKTAATRVLEARAQRNIAAGNLFPQSQTAVGDYAHAQLSKNLNVFGNPLATLPTNLNVWATGFNASWEFDFWGRLRRGIESKDADLSASVEDYHDALVTLLADVATSYVQIRTGQQRLRFARHNMKLQQGTLALTEARLKAGTATSLDVEQARTNLAQTEASIPPLAIGIRQANDRLCLLLGLPPQDLTRSFQDGPIPAAPPQVAVGIPAELLERRPDVRRAIRQAAAQSAQIGIAQADFYPTFGVSGFIGYAADDIRVLFEQNSFLGFILPNFQWKILNYGRIANNVKVQDARFAQRVLQYQKTVLNAGRETEDALVGFVESQVQAKSLERGVQAAERSVELVLAQYKDGRVDFNRVFTTQGQLLAQQDQLAAAQGNIALNLIAVYRALGGGWQAFESGQPCARPRLLPPIAARD
ncbi:MAG TPA: efflux transporter outer membrane subunit, partial [Gemmataceae bacterium]|nr:efflux transporter outer membrane subunit [Gemmataceae bacterium]